MKLLIVIIACMSITTISEELSLSKAQELLFQNNLDIASKRNDIVKSEWDIAEAHSSWYPSIDFYGNYNYLTEKNQFQYPPQFGAALPVLQKPLSLGTNYKTELGLDISYPLFTGLSRIYNINTRKWSNATAESSLQATRNRAAYKLGILYLRWHFSYKQQEVQEKHLQYLQEYARQTEILSEGGVIAPVKVIESRARLKAAQVELLETIQLSDSLSRELSGLIMLNDENIKPQKNGFNFDSIPIPSIIDSTRAELQMIQFNKNRLEESRKNISSQRLPTIGALAGYRVANPGLKMGGDQFMDYFTFGVQMKWNLFNGFKNRAQRFRLEKQMNQLDIDKSKNIDSWSRSLVTYRMEYDRSQEKIEAAKLSVEAADELVQSLAVSLQGGVITSVDHLYALNSLAQAELKLEQAILQKRVAIINAVYASGNKISF